MKKISSRICRGYIEGYYGRLPDWSMRRNLVKQISELGLSSYFYAPKEDIYHRLHWREPYPTQWRKAFSDWTSYAQAESVQIIAGVAPGLDFDFSHLAGGTDFNALVNKSTQLLDDGASHIALLMDDINTEFKSAQTGCSTEGEAHALLANALSRSIDQCVFVVPRVYANELDFESPGYAKQFATHLQSDNVIFLCGKNIVAASLTPADFSEYTDTSQHRIVAWDNLYAHDYCPRRLFVGAWQGRDSAIELMLNPTGLPATDALLLDIMASTNNNTDAESAHADALRRHGVPEEFSFIAEYFSHPTFSGDGRTAVDTTASFDRQLSAIEHCLWKWKTPLSREWYPYLFGLKHDLLISKDDLPALRIRKTQLSPLAENLIGAKGL